MKKEKRWGTTATHPRKMRWTRVGTEMRRRVAANLAKLVVQAPCNQVRAEFYVPAISHLTVFASREGGIIAPVLVAGAQAEHWLTYGLFQSDMPNGVGS